MPIQKTKCDSIVYKSGKVLSELKCKIFLHLNRLFCSIWPELRHGRRQLQEFQHHHLAVVVPLAVRRQFPGQAARGPRRAVPRKPRPIAPSPTTSIAQVAGSGTAAVVGNGSEAKEPVGVEVNDSI